MGADGRNGNDASRTGPIGMQVFKPADVAGHADGAFAEASMSAVGHYCLSDAYSSPDPEKNEAFRLPLAKKVSTPSTTLARQIDGA